MLEPGRPIRKRGTMHEEDRHPGPFGLAIKVVVFHYPQIQSHCMPSFSVYHQCKTPSVNRW